MNNPMGFLLGLKAPIDGLKLFFQHASLRRLVYFPLLLTLLVFVFGIMGFVQFMPAFYQSIQGPLMEKIQPELSQIVTPEWTEMGMASMDAMLKTSVYIVSFFMLIFFLFMVANVLCSVCWEFLAAEVSRLYGAIPVEKKTIREKWIEPFLWETVKQGLFGFTIIASYILAAVPLIGAFLSLILGPLIVTVWFSYMVCDYWFESRSFSMKLRWKLIWKQLIYLLGVGTYLIIPLIGFFLYPFFVIGASYHWTKFNLAK